jgi:hypothetical protein
VKRLGVKPLWRSASTGAMLSREQQKRVNDLCRQIANEKDHGKVAELARELNDLLETKAKPPLPTNG